MLISADYSQLEVIAFAHLCCDPNLNQLLRDGQDIHRTMYASLYNLDYKDVTKKMRDPIKGCTFLVIYGGSAERLHQTTGLPLEFCQKFIATFYKNFPFAKLWQQKILKEIERSGQITNFTGRILKFKKYPAKYQWQFDKGITESYNPSQGKDWPVQSLATGDIVMIALGQLYRDYLRKRKDEQGNYKYLLINTVHDSIMFDVRSEYLEECKTLIKTNMESVGQIIKTTWNVDFNLPLKVEISVGERWSDL